MRQVTVWVLVAGILLPGCSGLGRLNPWGGDGGAPGPKPDRSQGVQVVEGAAVIGFLSRADAFYERLAHRRFNSLATYRDEALREYFRTDASFSDYYADLAQAMVEAYFERNRPNLLKVREFVFDGPGSARVTVRIVGEDGRPLRIGKAQVVREDRWERLGGTWWIVPSKL